MQVGITYRTECGSRTPRSKVQEVLNRINAGYPIEEIDQKVGALPTKPRQHDDDRGRAVSCHYYWLDKNEAAENPKYGPSSRKNRKAKYRRYMQSRKTLKTSKKFKKLHGRRLKAKTKSRYQAFGDTVI